MARQVMRPRPGRGEIEALAAAVVRRLREDPERVIDTLRLLADPEALPAPEDHRSVALAGRVNADRLAARRAEFGRGALTTAQVGHRLGGISSPAVFRRAAGGRLLSDRIGRRRYFPDWQFGPNGPLPGLPRVLAAVGGRGALAADALMRIPLPEEGGRTAAQLLAAGRVDKAVHYVAIAGGGL